MQHNLSTDNIPLYPTDLPTSDSDSEREGSSCEKDDWNAVLALLNKGKTVGEIHDVNSVNNDEDDELEKLLLEIDTELARIGRGEGKKVCDDIANVAHDEIVAQPKGELSEALDPADEEFENARGELANLSRRLAIGENYEKIRSRFVKLSLDLNEEGAWAPTFRSYPPIPSLASQRKPWHSDLQRDLQVIDCHWLHCRQAPVFPRDQEFANLFDRDVQFDIELAETFAAKVWTTQHRVDEALGLTVFQQAQLAALRGATIIDRRRVMRHGAGSGVSRVRATQGKFRRAMAAWCERDPRMKSQQAVYEAMWEARELLGMDAPMSQISMLVAWKFGDGRAPLADKTVRDKLSKLDKRLSGTP